MSFSFSYSLRRVTATVAPFALSLCSLRGALEEMPVYSTAAVRHPEVGLHGMVSARERLASEAGLEVLRNGGNAIDAGVTVGFALAVTTPQAGNIGGGGFMLVHLADENRTVAIDYREKAPLAATPTLFLNDAGEVDTERSRYSRQAAGVPGTVAGLALALERFGTISLAEAMAPAIEMAQEGFPVGDDLYYSLVTAQPRIEKHSPHALSIFYDKEGEALLPGSNLKQPELAQTLRLIAEEGPEAFYEGEIAKTLVADMEANGGLISSEDLARYEPALREPVRGSYGGFEIVSMPPPSSGGIHIVQMLNILEPFKLSQYGHNSAKTIHLMAEAMKYAYADRSKHLGDSDFNPVPVEWLVSKNYASEIRARIDPDRTTPSSKIAPGQAPKEGENTTHFSIMDRHGNAVANTYTLNFSFGSKILVEGAGFFLNNEMDDFSSKPGVPNAYGLIGGEFNAIKAEKRMLSSMSPTIVLQDGKPVLLSGARGGSLIITATLQVLLNVIEHGMNVAEAVAAPRIHHQWLPDVLRVERGVSPDTIRLLEEMGYTVEVGPALATTNSAAQAEGVFYGAGDPRSPDTTAVGY